MLLTERYLKHALTIRLGSCSVHRPNQALPKRENTKSKYLYNNWKAKCAFDFRCSRIREFQKEIKKTSAEMQNSSILSFKLLEVILSLENLIGIGLR